MPGSLKKMVLLPRPRRITPRAGSLVLPATGSIVCATDAALLLPLAQQLRGELAHTQQLHWQLGAGSGGGVRLGLRPGLPAQGYRLDLSEKGIELWAADLAGARYGVQTLCQLLRQYQGGVPLGRIEDHPDFAVRGVMLDVTRDKVPTLSTLCALVDRLAEWKLNHLELYTEHTFAYRNHREVWAQASPLTGEDILHLDAHCRARGVELVPNQNSFGHLHRWLDLPRYRDLAECPDGFDFPWGRSEGPFSLSPAHPGSLKLVKELFAELLPHFSSLKFNVGCDETFDVGQGRSKALCEKKGKGRVYLDFVKQIHKLVRSHGRTMHFWGDIIIEHPELVKELPRDVVVLEWGYEAHHPFAEHGARFAEAGLPFYVCPGTSSWNSIAGRTRNCLGNLQSAAQNGLKNGAVGFLMTDWGDNGHWQYQPVSYLGFAAGAGLSWCRASNEDVDWAMALDLHAFEDQAGVMGKAAVALGDAYLRTGLQPHNSSPLFHILQRPATQELHRAVTEKRLMATAEYIEESAVPLALARMEGLEGALVRDEYTNTVRMLRHACQRGLALRRGTLGRSAVKRRLAEDLRLILGEHRRLWTARNREGGLQDSARRLETRLAEYTS